MVPAFRFLYQKADAEHRSFWRYLCAALNTPDGAALLVERFNRRDRGQWRWRSEVVLPTDFDHPHYAPRRRAMRKRQARVVGRFNRRLARRAARLARLR